MNIHEEITKVASRYFLESEVSIIIDDLKEWSISDDCLFFQMTQENNEPKLEIAYKSENIIVDYTFRKSKKEFIVGAFSAITRVMITEEPAATRVRLDGEGMAFLTYSASVEEYRKLLRNYSRKLQKLLSQRQKNV